MALIWACSDDVTPADTDAGSESETGDGDGDSGDGDGDDPATMTDTEGDGDGDPTDTGDGDGDTTDSGDGDGDTTDTGDGDGDTGDGDGDTGDGDGDTGDGDGDPMPADAMLRVLHLGLDAPAVDVYLDNGMMAAVAGLEFQSGTDYLPVPAGPHSVQVRVAGEPADAPPVLEVDPLDLAPDTKYSAVAYDYVMNLSALALVDDDAGIDPANTRIQVTHAAPDVGQVDVYAVGDPMDPNDDLLVLENVDYAATATIEVPAGPALIGIDVDDDMVSDLVFDVPDLGGGNFVDLYAVNEAGGDPAFLLAHLNDGTTARLDNILPPPPECGNDVIEGMEVCDGLDVATCADLGDEWGTAMCAMDCMSVMGCWSNPGPDWFDDFEAMGDQTTLVPWWTPTGDADGFRTQVDPQEGMWAWENGDIADSQVSGMLVNLNYAADGDVTFWYKTSTEGNWDFLIFRIDGADVAQWSGVNGWTQANFPVAAGQHTLEWVYDKDGSVSSNDDTVWVDNITTTGGAQANEG